MKTKWRPEGLKNPYPHCVKAGLSPLSSWIQIWVDERKYESFEAGVDATLDALFKMAKESPTGTFVIDSHFIQVYEDSK